VPPLYPEDTKDPVVAALMQAYFLLAVQVKNCQNLILSFQGFPGNAKANILMTMPAPMPNTAYSVAICPDYNTTVWVTGKSTTQFTCNFGTVTPTANQVIDFIVIG
jgi:hypothetical protein